MSLFDSLAFRRHDDPTSARIAAAITLIAAALTALGLVLVYSSTSTGIALKVLEEADATYYLRRQILWVSLGMGVFVLARTTDLDGLRRGSPWLLLAVGGALAAILVPGVGHRVGGAVRWIRVGPFQGQPSEAAKIALVIFTAGWASRQGPALQTLRGLLPGLLPIGALIGLVALEPDMGTAALLSCVAGGLLIAAGARIRHLLGLGAPFALVVGLFALTRLGYVRRRIATFLDPTLDPFGVGFQPRQAVIALGSGGVFGQGLGAGRQKLHFLQEVHTDYIFALVGEELGFLGAVAVVVAFAALVIYGLRAADRARDSFSFLVALGLSAVLGLQSVLNIAVATASVPPKGIALPFLSFGGSSLLMASCAAGLLARVAAEGREPAPLLDDALAPEGDLDLLEPASAWSAS